MNRWYGCSQGISDDLINFWDESIKNKMAVKAIKKIDMVGSGGHFFIWNHLIINVLVSSSRFIWVPMLRVYDHYKCFYFFSTGIDFRSQNLTSRHQIMKFKVGPCTEGVNDHSSVTNKILHPVSPTLDQQ